MATVIFTTSTPLDPIRKLGEFDISSVRLRTDSDFVADGTLASGTAATLSLRGSGFGTNSAGLRNGTAVVTSVEFSINGEVVLRVDGARFTGAKLADWLSDWYLPAFADGLFIGDDVMTLTDLPDHAAGYGGNDRLDGRGGNDILDGYSGNDMLLGGAGDDALSGSSGNDTLLGGDGNDKLFSGDGDDLIVGGVGSDQASGGAGTDTFAYSSMLRKQAHVRDLTWAKAVSGLEAPEEEVLQGFERIAFLDGTLHFDPADTAGQVWRLYGAAFGRSAETTGLSGWVDVLDGGAASLVDAASGFIGSAEFALRYGDLDDAGFVTRLYANVLGRAPDAAGLDHWTAHLARGASRADLLVGFSESAEYRLNTDETIADGLWTVDREAVDVLRCYVTILDRAPDAGGLSSWIAARNNGLTNAEMATGFIASTEFQTRFGALSDRDFVERMYQTALDRQADAAGLAAWVSLLDSGAAKRSDVVQGFAYSDEMTMKLLPLVSDGIAFA